MTCGRSQKLFSLPRKDSFLNNELLPGNVMELLTCNTMEIFLTEKVIINRERLNYTFTLPLFIVTSDGMSYGICIKYKL